MNVDAGPAPRVFYDAIRSYWRASRRRPCSPPIPGNQAQAPGARPARARFLIPGSGEPRGVAGLVNSAASSPGSHRVACRSATSYAIFSAIDAPSPLTHSIVHPRRCPWHPKTRRAALALALANGRAIAQTRWICPPAPTRPAIYHTENLVLFAGTWTRRAAASSRITVHSNASLQGGRDQACREGAQAQAGEILWSISRTRTRCSAWNGVPFLASSYGRLE